MDLGSGMTHKNVASSAISLGQKSGYRKALKRKSNRVVRRQEEFLQHGTYRKAFDYWYELY